jgi:hypothetical protein
MRSRPDPPSAALEHVFRRLSPCRDLLRFNSGALWTTHHRTRGGKTRELEKLRRGHDRIGGAAYRLRNAVLPIVASRERTEDDRADYDAAVIETTNGSRSNAPR